MPRTPATKPAATPPARNGHPAGEASAVASKRRGQIVDAAADIIATQGIHRLSLANIERRVGMTRGHLTYYFPTKEDILLAVFDRMLQRMIEEKQTEAGPKPGTGRTRECVAHMLARTLEPPTPDQHAFFSLIHTFHAQLTFRDDFRRKIAGANANWRQMIAADYARDVPGPPARPEIAASILMALAQGLTGQLAVDPNAFDRAEMHAALMPLLAPLFGGPAETRPPVNGYTRPPRAKTPKAPTRSRKGKSDD